MTFINEENAAISNSNTDLTESSASLKANDATYNSVRPEMLGSNSFKRDYGIKYAYLCGAMYKGIASKELVVRMGNAGLMGYLGTGGLKYEQIEEAIQFIQSKLASNSAYGVNLLHAPNQPDHEMKIVDLYLKYKVRFVEAAAFMQVTPALVLYRLKGIAQTQAGRIETPNHILGKISRPEIAEMFMRPAPEKIVQELLNQNLLTKEEARLAKSIPLAQDICVEADSGGHTDQGNAYVLFPAIRTLRDRIMKQESYPTSQDIRVGSAGGIGAPEAAVAAFMMGADFILTGSINQCTVEAGTSDAVKDILQEINVQDTDYAPAGDMFEVGARVQVVKRGVFFPARANKLYQLYLAHNSLEEIDERTRKQIQEKYFKRSFDDVWAETKAYYTKVAPGAIAQIEENKKQKMALIFRWYFVHSSRLAMSGSKEQRVDYQIHSGPALGAFNQWVKGTDLESWRNRHPDKIAELIMQETAKMLGDRIKSLQNTINYLN